MLGVVIIGSEVVSEPMLIIGSGVVSEPMQLSDGTQPDWRSKTISVGQTYKEVINLVNAFSNTEIKGLPVALILHLCKPRK